MTPPWDSMLMLVRALSPGPPDMWLELVPILHNSLAVSADDLSAVG